MTDRDSPQRIVERTAEPAFILDPAADRFLAANRAACAMLGYTLEVLLATPVSRIHRGELPQLQLVVGEVLKHGRATTDRLTCRTISGECLPVAMTLSSFVLDGRRLVIGLVRDRSEHRRAEKRLRSGSASAGTLGLMVTKALIVRLEAKPGKEGELNDFLREALPLVQNEPQTVAWFALQIAESSFAIVDAFPDEQGRRAHLDGAVAAALLANADELLAAPPDIRPADILAAKLP